MGKVIGQLVAVMVPLPSRLGKQDSVMSAAGLTPLVTASEDTQTQLAERPTDPTVTSTTWVSSAIDRAIHGSKSSAKTTATLSGETIRTDATCIDLNDADKSAMAVLGDPDHKGTESPTFVHVRTVVPSPDEIDKVEQRKDTLETETVNGDPGDRNETPVEAPHDANQAGLGSPSFVPARIAVPSQEIISRVDGSGMVGKSVWIPDTAIDAYLEMLSNHVNTIVGHAVVGVLSSTFWGWSKARFQLFGQREGTFTSSRIMTILVPRLANGNHWQLVVMDRKQQEIRVYCSMGFHMTSEDFLVSGPIDSHLMACR